ncbi:MAG: S46 family peptidase [Bacteroidales bacterium]|nr:S46 family peptidase [Bacteroidales bacterium]
MKQWLLTLSLALCLLPEVRADEGMWLIQCLDKALEKNMKARGLKLGAREIYNEEAGGLSDAVVSLGFYCTGSMISEDGLLITNHHCTFRQVSELSTPEYNYLEEGFWARNRAQEIPIKGEKFYFLRRVLDVTDEAHVLQDSLKADGKPFGARRLASLLEHKYSEEYGMEASLESMWSDSKYYICLYNVYTDVRLVGFPPVTVASFGGDEDNWEWPQHKADFALYRVYDQNGEPLHPKRHLRISRKGYKEGDFAMVLGYPGATNRYASAAEMNQEINVERPVGNHLRDRQMEITRKWMDADPSIRMKYSNSFFNLTNVAELQKGERECMLRFGVIPRRQAWEEDFGNASPENRTLLDSLNANYARVAEWERLKVYYRETLVRSMHLGQTLMRMGGAGRDGVEHQRRLLAEGLAQTDPRLEKEMLAFSLKEFLSHMPERYLSSFHKELKQQFGEDYDATAAWIWEHSCVADFGRKPDSEVVAQYAGPIDDDALYRYIRSLSIAVINKDQDADAPNLRDLRHQYVAARYEYLKLRGFPQYPDANSTMRLTYGRVQSLEPWDGVYTHWQSTARGLREKYNPQTHDFAYPLAFKEALPPADFPVNFLTDLDITGGNSGSPVLNARGELIGLAFDGNKESLAGNYESVPGYNMCVCVDIRYVLWILEHYAHQEYVLNELNIR